MDWRDWVVIERKADDKISDGIIRLRSMIERGFYNIKILKKEDRTMQAYLEFLAELQNEMATLKATNVNDIVDKRVEEFRAKAEAEELAKLEAAKVRKQIEIDTVNKLIDKVRVDAEAANVESTDEVVENFEEE